MNPLPRHPDDPVRESFFWTETAARLRAALASPGGMQPDERGRSFVAAGCRLVLPQILPPLHGRCAETYLAALPAELGVHAVILLQAGAAALGLWRGEGLVRHKVFRRYVVRGSGRAQPTHLRSKGKSRYGSRLRLQNARALLGEVNELLGAWWVSDGPFDEVFQACPVRLWADLCAAAPAPPFDAAVARKIARDVGRPNLAELQLARRSLLFGRVEREPDQG